MRQGSNPFVVGNWVRGERFYGRSDQIEEILSGTRRSIWLVGTRRSGKTSMLKQLEHLTAGDPQLRFFPIFWDLQGAENAAGLNESWADALLDAEDRLQGLGLDADALASEDVFESVGHVRRHLRGQGLRLLALCDEVEELIQLQQREPALLRRLRRALQSPDEVHAVLASSIRLWALSEAREDTSPFLHGFTPPLYLERLSDEAARSLVRQDQLPAEARPRLDPGVVDEIITRCDNHPYLLQLLAKRTVECGDLEDACERLANDEMVSHFFAVDVDMLSSRERRVLAIIRDQSAATSRSIRSALEVQTNDSDLAQSLFRLENLGYIRRDAEHRFELANSFFRRWLREQKAGGTGFLSASVEETQEVAGPASQDGSPGLGRIANRYLLLARLSEGAHGVVFRALDELLDTEIAIKVLKPELTAGEPMLGRLRQEILLSRDLGHPNVVRTYDLGMWEGRIYITMQWVDGPTLRQVIAEHSPLPVPFILRVGQQLASALEAAHNRSVLHRDLKPENVLMLHGSEPLVADFGLARIIGAPGFTREDVFVGTPRYASPEQADQRQLDERSDLYNLGLILFEMATGQHPFHADNAVAMLLQHSQQPAPDPRTFKADLPSELARVILRCLEKRPEDRFPSARALGEVLQALERLL